MNLNSDIQAIAEIRERTMQAENDGDADFVKSVCTEDIVVMPPGMQAVSGRSAALGFMHGFLEQFDLQILYVSAEIQIDGDIAYDRGTYSQHLAAKDGGTVATENGNYLWIYRRAADGTWKMARIIWNAIGPSPK